VYSNCKSLKDCVFAGVHAKLIHFEGYRLVFQRGHDLFKARYILERCYFILTAAACLQNICGAGEQSTYRYLLEKQALLTMRDSR